MLNLNYKELAIWIVCVIPLLFLFSVYHMLPAEIPINWNIEGEATRYATKIHLTWIMLLPLLLNLLFLLLPKIDPKRKNYDSFKNTYYYMRLGIVTFAFFIGVILVNAATDPDANPTKLIIILVAALMYFLAKLMPRIKQNYFVGFRLPWTLEDELTWDRTHVVGGRALQIASIIIAASTIFINNYKTLFIILISALLLTIIGIIIYSACFYYKQSKPKKKSKKEKK